jgi:uncharacterized membrane protein YqjE
VERDKSLIGVVTTIIESVIFLVRGHIELAKAELTEAFKNVVKSSVLFLIAIVLINLSVVFLLISLAIWLSEVLNMSNSAGFLIVGGSLFALSIALILIGLVKLNKVKNSPVNPFYLTLIPIFP